MYLFDFIKRIARKSNIPISIYLLLNIFIIAVIIQLLFSSAYIPFWKSLLTGIILYAISMVISLSPFGEWILRLQTGCKKLKRPDQINRIEPIFREVYGKAKELDQTNTK
jgi:heat shock protein HtpX